MTDFEQAIKLTLDAIESGKTLEQAVMLSETRFGTPAATLINIVRSHLLVVGLGF